jgi:nucleotide-binding universal stress UspA family protein
MNGVLLGSGHVDTYYGTLRNLRKASADRPIDRGHGVCDDHSVKDGLILICYDGSASARRAIDEAAKLLGPRRAVVLDVGPQLTTAESFAAVSSIVPGNAFEELNADDALARAREGAERARHAGFDAEPREELAAPTWEGIVDVAKDIDADAIVIGSRGLSGIPEAFQGSVSHQVAEHAGRPVLIVPPPRDRS